MHFYKKGEKLITLQNIVIPFHYLEYNYFSFNKNQEKRICLAMIENDTESPLGIFPARQYCRNCLEISSDLYVNRILLKNTDLTLYYVH